MLASFGKMIREVTPVSVAVASCLVARDKSRPPRIPHGSLDRLPPIGLSGQSSRPERSDSIWRGNFDATPDQAENTVTLGSFGNCRLARARRSRVPHGRGKLADPGLCVATALGLDRPVRPANDRVTSRSPLSATEIPPQCLVPERLRSSWVRSATWPVMAIGTGVRWPPAFVTRHADSGVGRAYPGHPSPWVASPEGHHLPSEEIGRGRAVGERARRPVLLEVRGGPSGFGGAGLRARPPAFARGRGASIGCKSF